MPDASFKTEIWKLTKQSFTRQYDQLAVEEPLEIHISYYAGSERKQHNLSVTMRTPGDDIDLALGFLFTEGIIQHLQQVEQVYHIKDVLAEGAQNRIMVELQKNVDVDLERMKRFFYTSSSCGVCGKTSIDAIRSRINTPLQKGRPVVQAQMIHKLPQLLREQQQVFEHTGGLHAAAVFNTAGKLLLLREDVGRHNAVDKLIGAALSKAMIPLNDVLILVSGRASFELIQKSLMAGIPILAAVGAPSSLAVQLAKESGMSVLGFVREERFNIYAGRERIA